MYRLEGSYRQIGAEYGALLKAARVPIPKASQTKIEFARQCAPIVREIAPYLFDELEGIAEGSGYDATRLKALALALDAQPACSAVAISGMLAADGKPLFGRNYDWRYAALFSAAFCHVRPAGAIPSMGCNDTLVGRMDGMNESGLAIAIAAVEGGRDYPGMMFPLAARVVLDRCHSTQSAVILLQHIRHARAVNFLVADASSDLAIVEACPFQVHVIRPVDGFAAITNQFQSDEMEQYEHRRARPRDSAQRLRILQEWFAARREPPTTREMQTLLREPVPGGVCNAGQGRRRRFGTVCTIWSWTARLGDPSLDLANGPPHETSYRTHCF
jgi:predicted choloylglycine hydrolase